MADPHPPSNGGNGGRRVPVLVRHLFQTSHVGRPIHRALASLLAVFLWWPSSAAADPDTPSTSPERGSSEASASASSNAPNSDESASTGGERATDPDDADDEGSSDDSPSDSELTAETTIERAESIEAPRFPSGWSTRLEPEGSFKEGRDLADNLERASGLSIRRQSSLGQPAFASIRGGNPRQMAVMLNGVRLGAPAGVGFDLSSVSTGWIADATLYRGAAAGIFGSGALAGALDLRTAAPERAGWRAEGTTMGGSFGTLGAALEGSVASESAGLQLDGSWRRADGDFTFVDEQGDVHTRINNGHERIVAHGTGTADLEGHDVTSTVVFEQGTRGAPGPSEYQRAYRRADVERRRLVGTLGWRRKGLATGEWGAFDARIDAGYIDRFRRYENPDPFIGRRAIRNASTHRSFGLHARGDAFLTFGHIAHLALEARLDTFDANYQWAGTSELEARRTTLAAGLSDEWLLFDRSVSLIGGVRTELIRGRELDRVPIIPSGGLIWRARPWLTLKSNVARTHRTPDFDELYLRTETLRGNPDLAPERALQWDAGLELGTESWPVAGRATFFQSDIRETILFLPETAYLYRAQNLEGASSLGVETALQARPIRWLNLRAGYTWTDVHLDATPDVQLPHRPEHRAHLRGTLELADWWDLGRLESLRLSTEARVRSRVNLDNFGNLTNPPFGTVDVGLAVAPVSWLTMGIDLHNLADDRRGADSLHRPLPGRAVYVSLTLEGDTSQHEETP